MIIDIHGHLGNINFAPFWQADTVRLEEYLEQTGIDQICVSSARALMYDVREGNKELAEALGKTEKLLGYVTVNPMFPNSIEDLHYLENPKFIGIKVHPDYHGYDVSSIDAQKFLDKVAGEAKLMLFHVSCMPGTGFADAIRIAEFAGRHPKTNFVLAHMAGVFQNGNYPYFPNLQGCENIASMGLNNVYIDTAHYLMYVYPGVMEKMVKVVGADHIVFGTDSPLQGPMQMRFAKEIIQALDIPLTNKDKILFGNAQKILRLK